MKQYKLLVSPLSGINENIDKAPGHKYSNLDQVMVKHQPYENVVRVVSQNLEKMIKDIRLGIESENLQTQDLDFIKNDVLGRMQDALSYAISSIEALKSEENTS